MQRLRVLEQDVVGDVHDVVDRPHAGRPKAALHPVRARPDPDARDHAADVAAAQLGVDDADLDQVAARRVGRARERGHEVALHRAVEPGAELARDAEVAHAVRAVGGDLGFHDRLARDHRRQRLTRCAAVQDQDAGVVVTEQQLGRRAQHAARLVAGDVHVLDDLAVGHRRSRQGDRHQAAGDGVGRAGDDLLHAPAKVDLVHPEVVARLRVLGLLEHLADDDGREVDHGQRLDLDALARQHVGGVLGRDAVEVEEIAQPFVADSHFLNDPTFPGPKSRCWGADFGPKPLKWPVAGFPGHGFCADCDFVRSLRASRLRLWPLHWRLRTAPGSAGPARRRAGCRRRRA